MGKKGQFFLIAALVIISVLVSLVVIYNSSFSPQEDMTTYDLSNELDFEISQVIDQGIINSAEDSISQRISSLTEEYSKTNPDKDITVWYGDGEAIFFGCAKEVSSGIDLGTQTTISTCEIKPIKLDSISNGLNVVVLLPTGEFYQFTLEQGQKFFIVTSSEDDYGQAYRSANTDTIVSYLCAPIPDLSISEPCKTLNLVEGSTTGYRTTYVSECSHNTHCEFKCLDGTRPNSKGDSCI